MAKFKLVEMKANPLDKNDTRKKYYAKPQTERALSPYAFSKLASVGMTVAAKEMEAGLVQFGEKALEYIVLGRSVEIPGIGTLHLTFRSEGVDSPTEFNAASMIKSPRIIFTPKPEVREALRTGLFFELAGIQQGKTFYKTLKDFKEGNGTTISGNGGTTSGNDSGTTPGGDNGGNTPGGNDNPGGIE